MHTGIVFFYRCITYHSRKVIEFVISVCLSVRLSVCALVAYHYQSEEFGCLSVIRGFILTLSKKRSAFNKVSTI